MVEVKVVRIGRAEKVSANLEGIGRRARTQLFGRLGLSAAVVSRFKCRGAGLRIAGSFS